MLIVGVLFGLLGLFLIASVFFKTSKRSRGKKGPVALGLVLIICSIVVFTSRNSASQATGATTEPYTVKTVASQSELQAYLGDGGNALAYKEVTASSEQALQYFSKFKAGIISSSQLTGYLQNNYQTVDNVFNSYGLRTAPADLSNVDQALRSNAKQQILYVAFLKNAAQHDDTTTLQENAQSLQAYVQDEQSIQSQLATLLKRDTAAQGKQASNYYSPGPQQISVGGGLGDTLKTIEKYYGMPTQVVAPMNNGVGSYDFGLGISVSFEDGRVYLFQRDFTGGAAHFAMQVMGSTAFPKNASSPLSTRNTSNGFIGVYQSADLAKVFSPNLFIGPNGAVPAGTFTLVDTTGNGDTTISLSIGNNP